MKKTHSLKCKNGIVFSAFEIIFFSSETNINSYATVIIIVKCIGVLQLMMQLGRMQQAYTELN